MKRLIDDEKLKKGNEFYDRIHQVEVDHFHYWQENILWNWEFWLSAVLSVLPWVIWFIFRKRGSEARLLLAGCFVLIIACWLDFMGVISGLWYYSGKVMPTIPSFFPWDFSLLPVIMMLWLQYKPNLHPLLKAFIFSAFSAFIGEPFFEWVGMYCTEKWSSFYSFIIYMVIYLLAHWISRTKAFDSL
ncbi:CBO0543 family protein [Neobacillus mesonae]|uniref:CBO0543 family protein n=1 Tax=Neobacillus mesonae TaxID=1193713 RepID=UPI002042458A|nr:CBO0543 family protein [Neobacillus mesonae]MCM3567262.1 hypothetical protein [Neobacillus mesonae]